MKFFGKSKSNAKAKKEDMRLRREENERAFDRTTSPQARQLRRKHPRDFRAVDERSQLPIQVNTLRSGYQGDFAPTNSILSNPNGQISAHELNSNGELYRTEKAEKSLPKTPWIPQTESISETNNETLRAENTRLTKHASLLESQVQDSSKTREKVRNNAQELKGSWGQRTQKLEKDLGVSESRNTSIRESLKRAEWNSSQRERYIATAERQLEERNESAQKEVRRLQERNDKTRHQVLEKQEDIEALMEQLDIEKEVARCELEDLRTCHMREQAKMEKSLQYELKDLRNRHKREQAQLQRSLECEFEKLHIQMTENTAKIKELNLELNEARHAREESERSKSSMKERLNAMEALLSQRENQITELEQQIQENTDMVAETRLILNQSRNELNVEKRKARQVSQEVADKNRKLEFLQQECAKMSGDLIKRRYQ